MKKINNLMEKKIKVLLERTQFKEKKLSDAYMVEYNRAEAFNKKYGLNKDNINVEISKIDKSTHIWFSGQYGSHWGLNEFNSKLSIVKKAFSLAKDIKKNLDKINWE